MNRPRPWGGSRPHSAAASTLSREYVSSSLVAPECTSVDRRSIGSVEFVERGLPIAAVNGMMIGGKNWLETASAVLEVNRDTRCSRVRGLAGTLRIVRS